MAHTTEVCLFFNVILEHIDTSFHSNEKVEMAIREWLRMQESDLDRGGVLKLASRWDECVQGIVEK